MTPQIMIQPMHLSAVIAALGSPLIIPVDDVGTAIAEALQRYACADDLQALTRNDGEARDHVRRSLETARKLLKLLDGSEHHRTLMACGLLPHPAAPHLGSLQDADATVTALRTFVGTAQAAISVPTSKGPDAINQLLDELSEVYIAATGQRIRFTINPITGVVTSDFLSFWEAATVYALGKRPPGPDAIRKRLERRRTRNLQISDERQFAESGTRGSIRRQPTEAADDQERRDIRSEADRGASPKSGKAAS